jgi:branched-chain amino acid aminotransferase
MKVFLNGNLVEAREARVSVFDHGFLYGDGIYETVCAYDFRVFSWPMHDRRLRQSARRLALSCPWSSSFLESAVRRLLKANHQPNGSVRITVSRGPGSLGLNPKLWPKPTLAMMLHPERPVDTWRHRGVSIAIVNVRRNHPRCLDPRIKSNNNLNTIFARMEADHLHAFEGILLNLDGFLTEGTTTNIFFVRRGVLHTPALHCGLLEGVTRDLLIRLARREKIPLREGRYTPKDLMRADEVFLASTTLEVMPVVRMLQYRKAGTSRARATSIGSGRPGPLADRLHQLLGASRARVL